jgi:hypothetical protein
LLKGDIITLPRQAKGKPRGRTKSARDVEDARGLRAGKGWGREIAKQAGGSLAWCTENVLAPRNSQVSGGVD